MRTIELSSLHKKDLRNPSRYLVHPLSFTTSISQLKSSKRVIFPQRGINPHLVARLTRGTTGGKEDSLRSGGRREHSIRLETYAARMNRVSDCYRV